jgi:hypothetical protein
MRHRTVRALLIVASFAVALAAAGPAGAAWPIRPPLPTPPPPPALDEETLARLVIFGFALGEEPAVVAVGDLGGGLQIQPGGALALTLGVYECCYVFEPVKVRAVWSVAPPDGARVDPASGLLEIDEEVPSGSRFTVRAEVAGGQRVVEAEVAVFTPEANPLVGVWREEAQLDCASGAEIAPASPIGEVVFKADGTFSVTWVPFEIYQDYWGSYAFDLARGKLELTIAGGNYVPPDLDGSGRFALDAAGQLLLTDLWLGTPPDGAGPANCGHRLVG